MYSALDGVDDLLGHTAAMWTAHRRIDWREDKESGDVPIFVSTVGAALLRQTLQLVRCGHDLRSHKALQFAALLDPSQRMLAGLLG